MTRPQIIPSIFVSILLLLTQSSGYAQTKKALPAKTASKPVTVKVSVEDIELGKQLLSKSDCMACHKVDVKLVGPSYLEVAKKYPATEANYSYLANKIIKGGSGVWGQIAMSPHPTISVADAKKIATYILSIK